MKFETYIYDNCDRELKFTAEVSGEVRTETYGEGTSYGPMRDEFIQRFNISDIQIEGLGSILKYESMDDEIMKMLFPKDELKRITQDATEYIFEQHYMSLRYDGDCEE